MLYSISGVCLFKMRIYCDTIILVMVILRSLLHGTKAAEKPNRTQQCPDEVGVEGGHIMGSAYYG